MSAPQAVVYVLKDDASFRKSVERLICASGYEVVAFESANSLLAWASVPHSGFLLLDVRLPDVDDLRLQKDS